jgi:hypothetical protein
MGGELKKRPKLRKLQIAFSAVCGVLCLLLIALWVRSYWRQEHVAVQVSPTMKAWTTYRTGWVMLRYTWTSPESGTPPKKIGWEASSYIVAPQILAGKPNLAPPPGWSFKVHNYPNIKGLTVRTPFWFLTLASFLVTLLVAARRIRFTRFSLRTLLIAAILVAVGLGLIVAASR